jgi:hypothetical protein
MAQHNQDVDASRPAFLVAKVAKTLGEVDVARFPERTKRLHPSR